MAVECGSKKIRRKPLALVNADGNGARIREELGIQALLNLDQSIMWDIRLQPPVHLNGETDAIKAGIQRPLSSSPEQLDEGGRVELLERNEFPIPEQDATTFFTGLLEVDSRLGELGGH